MIQGAADPRMSGAIGRILELPIFWWSTPSERTDDEIRATGHFAGATECARYLEAATGARMTAGSAFGGPWPLLEIGETFIAPALPAAVGTAAVAAVDGEYRRADGGVWREAVGCDELYLSTEAGAPSPGAAFEVLWYGEGERFALRRGTLEIEDLFGRLTVPASRELLDRLLARGRRVDPEAVSRLEAADAPGSQWVEVRREAKLVADDRWRDPAALLAAREGIDDASQRGDVVVVRTHEGARLVFESEILDAGWELRIRDGDSLHRVIRLERLGASISLRAELAASVDGMAPGMRGRLIFDLRSDLVMLT